MSPLDSGPGDRAVACLLLSKGKILGGLLDLAMGTSLTLTLHSLPAISAIFNEVEIGLGQVGLVFRCLWTLH